MFGGALLLLFVPLVHANYDFCEIKGPQTVTAQLKSFLLCDYDSSLRPVRDHRNATTVTFRMMLKYFNYDHFSHMLSVDAWFPMYWVDQHLKWKPEDYDGIKSIHLSSLNDLWVPDLSIYNRKDLSVDPGLMGDTRCLVSFKGLVLCVPSIHFDALCVPELKKFPYDVQNCTVRFGSWVHNGEEINIKHLTPIILTEDLEPNGEWELLSFYSVRRKGNFSCCPNNTYPSVEVTFEIKRHSSTHNINGVLPLLVGILLTITTMAMSPLNNDRLILCCVNLIAHVFHLQNLSFLVPINGDNVPSLFSISRDSLLMTGVSLISTVLLKYLMKNKSPSPAWMSGTISVLVGSRPGQFLFLSDNSIKGVAAAENREDGVTIISNSESMGQSSNQDWLIFGKIIDVLLFIIYLIVYFTMLVTF